MVRKPVVLITGASGEIGHGLVDSLSRDGQRPIITLDLKPLEASLAGQVQQQYLGSVLDGNLLERILSEYEVDLVFHLAALLSTRGEFTPTTAHQVNVEGMLRMLEFAQKEGESHGRPVVFLYPSSIAAYGLPDLLTKARAGRVREEEWNAPTTMYGCNKLYCEQLGTYFSKHYRQLAAERPVMLDFRCLRFPGLISAFTVPSGGTSDYGPEMLHAAAKNEPYACFVREDVRIPFMVMPDAIKSLVLLTQAPREALRHTIYNVTSFSLSAEEFRKLVLESFPQAQLTYQPDLKRQAIVDSWPADLELLKRVGEEATRITGYPTASVFHHFRYEAKTFMRGAFDDWIYDHLGVFAWTTEFWSPQRQAGITDYKYIDWYREHPVEDDLKLMKWNDTVLKGKGFVDWYEFDGCPADEMIQVAQSFGAMSRLYDDGDLDERGDGHQAGISGLDGFDEGTPFGLYLVALHGHASVGHLAHLAIGLRDAHRTMRLQSDVSELAPVAGAEEVQLVSETPDHTQLRILRDRYGKSAGSADEPEAQSSIPRRHLPRHEPRRPPGSHLRRPKGPQGSVRRNRLARTHRAAHRLNRWSPDLTLIPTSPSGPKPGRFFPISLG